MIYYALYALSAFMLSLVGVRVTILTLKHHALLMDNPNQRSNHTIPTPRGGGIAVVFTLIIFLVAEDAGFSLMFGMLLLAAISLMDDWFAVPPLARLMVQMIAVGVAIGGTQGLLFRGFFPIDLDVAFTFVLWLWFINLYNFMDGIDGIAGIEAISIAIGICLVYALQGNFEHPLFAHALAVFAVMCGFLWWNWHPARIFLGDVGSIPIGFLLGWLLIKMGQDGGYAPALTLPAYYLTDASVTLIKRIRRGEKIWQAHSEHYYQQAVRAGRSHDQVARIVFGVNMLLIMLAVLSALEPETGWLNVATAYAMCGWLCYYFSQGKKPHAA